MFCSKCGHQNPQNSKFCESCGNELQLVKKFGQPQKTDNANKRGRLASIGGALVIICFFLPWVLGSCSGDLLGNNLEIKISGSEIASGNYGELEALGSIANSLQGLAGDFGLDAGSDKANTSSLGLKNFPALYMIPVFCICGLISLNGKRSGAILSVTSGILGIVGLLIFLSRVNSMKNDLAVNTYGLFDISYQFGYFGEWIGLAWQTFFGFLGLNQSHK